ncbi:hypothetical protein ABV23_RS01685 [Escherichia coli]|nr:hypothetical protein [Escherichia coli]
MSNVYKRIGEVLEGNNVINSVLAYSNDDEEVLKGAGFTRTGSVDIDGEIVDVYTLQKKRNVVFIDDSNWSLDNLKNFREKHNIGLGSFTDNLAYLRKWDTKF